MQLVAAPCVMFFAMLQVRLNEDGTIYCGALETLSSYTPSIAQKLGATHLDLDPVSLVSQSAV